MLNLLNSKLIKSIFSYVSAVTISQAFMVVYTVGIIWWLNTENYGLIAANYATVSMLSFVITLGLHEWLVRTIPTAKDPQVLTGNIIKYKLSVGLLWGLIIWLIMPLIQPGVYQKNLLAIIIIDIWLDSIFNLLLADLLGNERAQKTSALLILSRALRVLSLGLIIVLQSSSIIFISFLRLICTVIVLIIALTQAKPILKTNQKAEIAKVLRYSLVFNASELFNLVFLQLDLNLLTWINGDTKLIGDFAIAINLINMIMTVPLAVVYLVLPSTINLSKISVNKFRKRLKKLLAGFLFLGLVLWLGVWVLRTVWIQNLLGNNYHSAINLLVFASPLLFIRTANQFNRVYLFSVKWESKQLIPQMISIILKFALGIFLVAKWDVMGLIWLSIGVDLILLVSFSLQVIKHSKVNLKCAN